MPSSVEENGTGLLIESEKKGKKNRYSLKKFINNRISPNLLRLNRSAKSAATDTDKDSENSSASDLSKPNTRIEMSTAALGTLNSSDKQLAFPGSSELCHLPLTSDHNISPGVDHIVEEYEESLTQFADMILESFKSPGQVPDSSRSQDSGSELSGSQQLSHNLSSSPSSAAVPWLFNMLPSLSKGDVTPPSNFVSMHRFPPDSSVSFLNSTGIYNEPCDAKPLGTDGSSDPTVIYTLSSLHRQLTNVAPGTLGEPYTNTACSSSRSSSSNMIDSDAQSLQLPSTMLPGDVRSGVLSTKSAEVVAERSSSGTPSGCTSFSADYNSTSLSPHLQQHFHQHTQKNPGFIDAPRGNSVIVHHPTSPFARVPRGPPSEQKQHHAVVPSTPLEAIEASKLNSAQQPSHITQPNSLQSDSLLSRILHCSNGNRLMAPKATVEDYSSVTRDTSKKRTEGRGHSSDGHPTYEEAWDLKLARQLGFGMSRLTPMLEKQQQSTPSLDPSIGASPVAVTKPSTSPTSNLPSRPIPPTPINQFRLTNDDLPFKRDSHSTTETVSSLSTQKRTLNKCGPVSNQKVHEPAKFIQNSEYDYAYNGSWSMGVQMNLNLAMNQNNDTLTTSSAATRIPGRISKSPLLVAPPAVPAHKSKRTGLNGHHFISENATSQPGDLPQAPLTTNAEFDDLSADSFDDSWDRTHQGRFVGELTNCRVLDPKTVLSTLETANRGRVATTSLVSNTKNPSVPQLERPLPSVSHQCLTESIPSPSWTVKAAPLISLPLEEQPWFHPSLSRSEAEELLSNAPEGSFLVRNSETCHNDYSLTIRHKAYLHMKISRNARGQFILGEYSQPYNSVPHMIYHYASTSVPVRGAEYVMLLHPVHRQLAHPRQKTQSPLG